MVMGRAWALRIHDLLLNTEAQPQQNRWDTGIWQWHW
jgi:hypothetical protein